MRYERRGRGDARGTRAMEARGLGPRWKLEGRGRKTYENPGFMATCGREPRPVVRF